jgi:hypothetical protein
MAEEVKQTPFTVKAVPFFSDTASMEAEGLSGSPVGFMSTMWMVVKYLYPEATEEDFSLYSGMVAHFNSAAEGTDEEKYEGNKSLIWLAHTKAVVAFLAEKGIDTAKTKTWVDMTNNIGYGHFSVLEYVLRYGPVAIKTNGLGGKDGEGMILALYLDSTGAIVYHDPRGNALTGYTDPNGELVKYPKECLTPYVYEGVIPMMLVTKLSL